jgi:hypothetical protein
MYEDQPIKVFLIPSDGIPTKNLRISIDGFSKYHKFQIWPN